MQVHLGTITRSAIISTVVVLPFLVLELVNTQPQASFPLSLFVFLWLLPFFVLLLLLPARRWLHDKERLPQFWIRVLAAALLYAFWLIVLIDQLPCFLGVPDCD